MVGIPMTVSALVPILLNSTSGMAWVYAALLFIGGYALQFLGHAIEGNDAGELIVIKKMLGKPYVAIAPQFAEQPAQQ